MREGLYNRVLSPHPSHGTGGAEPEVCHLLVITAPRINDEMTFVPTKDESFIRGFSKREDETGYHHWYQNSGSYEREILQTRSRHDRVHQHSDVKRQHNKEVNGRVLDQCLHKV